MSFSPKSEHDKKIHHGRALGLDDSIDSDGTNGGVGQAWFLFSGPAPLRMPEANAFRRRVGLPDWWPWLAARPSTC